MTEHELIVDNFAGGGGASLGIEQALRRPVDLAINHDAEAIAVHRANHPGTRHLIEDVWQVDPLEATGGRPVGLAWFSPDCKHFSKAKGGRPVEKRIRGLAWVVVGWATAVRPRVIMLENVEEFQTWGPLDPQGNPRREHRGRTFRAWWRKLERIGYEVQMRELRACAYGAPTIRKRLFIIARRDGLPIVWPDATHGAGLLPFRTAAECIDWDLPCPSIFERRYPLAEATLRRIARGLKRFVFEAAEPFVVTCNHTGSYRERGVDEPFRTLTGSRDAHGLVMPFLSEYHGRTSENGDRVRAVEDPLAVQTTENRFALVAPLAVTIDHRGQGDRGARRSDEPLATSTVENRHALVMAFMDQANTGMTGHEAGKPLSTIVGRGTQQRIVAAHVEQANGGMSGSAAGAPIGTVPAGPHHSLVASSLVKMRGTCRDGQRVDEPAPTVSAQGNHLAEVRAFLVKYYGQGTGQSPRDPMATLTAKDRLGLVTVKGEDYRVVDIGMRMLQPRELFRAQGFPDQYVIAPMFKGRSLSKTSQVRMCGNSVCPQVARALVEANLTVGGI